MLAAYCIVTVLLTKELATDQCTKFYFKSPFYPGESCEDIYNKNPESRDIPGYYWILDGPIRVYCGMTYTGSSCEDIYNGNAEIRDKSGYYHINDTQWTYCNMTEITITTGDLIPTCAGVGGVGLSQICSKYCLKCFWEFPKFSPIMLFQCSYFACIMLLSLQHL